MVATNLEPCLKKINEIYNLNKQLEAAIDVFLSHYQSNSVESRRIGQNGEPDSTGIASRPPFPKNPGESR